jgi:hypothetical protein
MDRQRYMSQLPNHLGGALQHLHGIPIDGPDGTFESVAFMARDGYSLPAPPR